VIQEKVHHDNEIRKRWIVAINRGLLTVPVVDGCTGPYTVACLIFSEHLRYGCGMGRMAQPVTIRVFFFFGKRFYL
jgi:hypothetical protein